MKRHMAYVSALFTSVVFSGGLRAFTVENNISQQIHANCVYINNLTTSVPVQPGKTANMKCIAKNKIGSLRVTARGTKPAIADLASYSSQELDSDDLVFKVTQDISGGAGAVIQLKIVAPKKEQDLSLQDVSELPTLEALGGASATELKTAGAGVVA